jgi:lysophospholipase L1-like esterase
MNRWHECTYLTRFGRFAARCLLFFLVLTLAAPSLFGQKQSAVASQDKRTEALKIVTLGDSITKGVRAGVAADQTFASLVEKLLQEGNFPAQIRNVGIGGERTDQAMRRLDAIIDSHPDIVTVMYGTNDSYVDPGRTESRISRDEYRSNLESIVTRLLSNGIVPVLMTEPRWSDDARPNGLGENPNVRLEPYVQICREVAKEWRVPLVDNYAEWSEARKAGVNLRTWTTDGCHPNPQGHEKIAEALEYELLATVHTAHPSAMLPADLGKRKSLKVVCFGDSVTGVYYHTGSRRAYTDMLGIALQQISPQSKIEMVNAGISGNTTVNGLARLDKDVLAHKPDVVTVMFGLNDMTRVPLSQYSANLKEIVTKCRAIGAEVVLATPNNVIDTSSRPTSKLIQYCDAVREVAREMDLPICDTYRELQAVRAEESFSWRLLMSDEIHPNMDGHKRIAEQLADAITGHRVALDVAPQATQLSESLAANSKRNLRVLAMPPYDEHIVKAIEEIAPNVTVQVESWNVEDKTLAEIENDAKQRVRRTKPDLVIIAVPRSASADNATSFAKSFAWVMNWSLNFGPPTWDCLVIHPAVVDPTPGEYDQLIRQLVQAQDLLLVDRPADSNATATAILSQWLKEKQ